MIRGRDLGLTPRDLVPLRRSSGMYQVPTIIAAVAIDVDLTALVMCGLFIALYYLLQPIIVNDYLRAREMRKEAVEGAREEARESQALAEARMLEFEDEMKVARREAAEVRESLRGQGTAEQRDLVEEAREEVQAKLTEERDKIAAQVGEAEKELKARAAALSNAMVDKILPSAG